MFRPTLTTVALLFGLASADVQACATITYGGRTADRLFFTASVREGVLFSLTPTSTCGLAETLTTGDLPSNGGSGEIAWSAVLTPEGDVMIRSLTAQGDYEPAGKVRPPATPFAFTWAADAQGSPWLFFLQVHGGSELAYAFRRVGEKWVRESTIHGWGVPRLDRESGTLSMRSWRIAAGAAPQPLVSRLPDQLGVGATQWFVRGGTVLVGSIRDGLFATDDGGVTWRKLTSSPVREFIRSDDDGPVVARDDGAAVRILSWRGGSWVELATIPREEFNVAGQMMVHRGRVVVLGVCYSSDSTGDWIRRSVYSGREKRSERMTIAW